MLCVDFRAGEPLFKLLLVCGCYELCPDPELRGEDSCGRKNILVSAHPQSVCVCVCVVVYSHACITGLREGRENASQ